MRDSGRELERLHRPFGVHPVWASRPRVWKWCGKEKRLGLGVRPQRTKERRERVKSSRSLSATCQLSLPVWQLIRAVSLRAEQRSWNWNSQPRRWQLHPRALPAARGCPVRAGKAAAAFRPREEQEPPPVPSLPRSPPQQLIPAAETQSGALIKEQRINALIRQPERSLPGAKRVPCLGSGAWLCPAPHRCLTTDTPAQCSISLSEFRDLRGFCGVSFAGKEKRKTTRILIQGTVEL